MSFDDTTINYQNVVACKEYSSVTRLLASDLMSNPYLTIGDFLQGLTDGDLKVLSDLCDITFDYMKEGKPYGDDTGGDKAFAECIMLTMLLSGAEGLDLIPDENVLTQRVGMFSMFVAMESLYRKGMVKLHHKNMSLGEDASDKIVVEKI